MFPWNQLWIVAIVWKCLRKCKLVRQMLRHDSAKSLKWNDRLCKTTPVLLPGKNQGSYKWVKINNTFSSFLEIFLGKIIFFWWKSNLPIYKHNIFDNTEKIQWRYKQCVTSVKAVTVMTTYSWSETGWSVGVVVTTVFLFNSMGCSILGLRYYKVVEKDSR